MTFLDFSAPGNCAPSRCAPGRKAIKASTVILMEMKQGVRITSAAPRSTDRCFRRIIPTGGGWHPWSTTVISALLSRNEWFLGWSFTVTYCKKSSIHQNPSTRSMRPPLITAAMNEAGQLLGSGAGGGYPLTNNMRITCFQLQYIWITAATTKIKENTPFIRSHVNSQSKSKQVRHVTYHQPIAGQILTPFQLCREVHDL